MRLVVEPDEEFTCPVCGMRYTLWEEDPGVPLVAGEDGEWCEHFDPEVFPLPSREYEVYFRDPEPDEEEA